MSEKSSVFTIVIADDEAELREAICSLVDWSSIGFRLLGSAGNGLEALQLVEQVQPDLLLTDIRMPFISGTELAKQVRELQPLIQVAFLSGYDDFEYARSAIDSQVIAYLLKPISTAELTRALTAIHRKMEDRFRELNSGESDSGPLTLAVSSVLLCRDSSLPPEAEIRRLLLDNGMDFSPPYELVVLAAEVEGSGLLDPSAAAMADRILGRYCSCGSYLIGRQVISLVISEDGFSSLQEMLDMYYYTLRRLLGAECAIGVSSRFSELSRSGAAMREAVSTASLSDQSGVHYAGSGLTAPRQNASMKKMTEQALRIIDENYQDETLSLSSVSGMLHVSPNYLSANMKKYEGDTFINFLIRRRMEAALSLIGNSSMKIADVAEKCGYSDQHYFSYCFKKYYGVSPVKMRRKEAGS